MRQPRGILNLQVRGLKADFVYYDNNLKKIIVEDTKGVKTKEYILKRKLLLYMFNIRIHEI